MSNQDWDIIIKPRSKFKIIDINALFQYKDLLFLFVKRDLVSIYKQTLLGPLWLILQPVLTALMFNFVFGKMSGFSNDGTPSFLFYLSGVTIWTFFSDCCLKTSETFSSNANLFGKVYFPRLIVPLSVITSNIVKFGFTFLLFLVVLAFNLNSVSVGLHAFLLPVLILITAGLGLGFGLIISALTARYRDLKFLVQFGVQLLMFLSPVIYPISSLSGNLRSIILLNPMTSIIETFKFGFSGHGYFSWFYLGYSFAFMLILLLVGLFMFTRVERNFMDTV